MYRIYGKCTGLKRFSPMDWEKGNFVVNLIYATLVEEVNIEKAKAAMKNAVEQNADINLTLQLRDMKNKIVYSV